MLRLFVLFAAIGIALCSPIEVKKIKTRKIYSFNGVVGGGTNQPINSVRTTIPSEEKQSSESAHVRFAPQDPFVTADEQIDISVRSNVDDHHQHHSTQHNEQRQPIRFTTTTTKRPVDLNINFDELNQHQAQHAHYQFDSSIQDDINDHSHTRTEQRDGLKVTGMYSYSDGFYHRTVEYIADENGYRVVKESAEKIGEGPQFNADGVADVKSSLIGGYSIKIDDREHNPHYIGLNNKLAS